MNFFKKDNGDWINLDRVEYINKRLGRVYFNDEVNVFLSDKEFKRLEEILESNFEKKGVKIK